MKRVLPLTCLALSVTACAEHDTRHYPSLLPRPIESRTDVEPAAPPPAEAKPDAPTDAKLAKLRATLDETTKAFGPAADRAQQAAEAAKGDSAGSEHWIAAQTALAELDGYRATVSATLTDIEQMAIERATNAEPDYPGIGTLRAAAEAEFKKETARISAIQAGLPTA
jgi:hypothetical protein